MFARILLLGVLLTGAVAQPAASQGEAAVAWDQVGAWHIGVDATMDDSCFALIAYQDGTALRVGFDKHQTVHFVIGNVSWEPLVAGNLMASGKLRFVYRGRTYARLPILGGGAAIERMVDCQDAAPAADGASAASAPPGKRELSF